MKNKLITIIIAMLLLVSVVYAPNNNENNPQRSEDAPGQELRTTGVELSFAPFDLSSVSPELTSVFSYKLMFIDTPARIGDLRVKKILLSNQGAYTADEEESYARIDLADLNQDGNFMVHIANIPFLLYKSEDADGQGNPGYVLVDSRAQEANSPDSIDYQDARYFALVLYNHDNNQGSYAFSDLNGLREKQFLARDGSEDATSLCRLDQFTEMKLFVEEIERGGKNQVRVPSKGVLTNRSFAGSTIDNKGKLSSRSFAKLQMAGTSLFQQIEL